MFPQWAGQRIWARVKPERKEAILKDVAKKYTDRLDRSLRKVMDEGLSIFSNEPPMKRHAAYMAGTLPNELLYVLTPGYGDMVRDGLLPWPLSPMWTLLFSLPPFVADHYVSDFQQCHEQDLERIERHLMQVEEMTEEGSE